MLQVPWGPVQQEMLEILCDEPVDIAGVVYQLERIQKVLAKVPPMYGENPVADFNQLYATITSKILDRHQAGDFADPEFLNRLDVEFAKRYFDALRLWGQRDRATPEVWTVLFRRLTDTDLRSLPCAVAGVNAHINYDLPFALVATWQRLGHMATGSPQHQDYLLVNEVFFDAIPGLRRGYLERWQRYIDRINGRFDDWYQNLLVEITRGRAWDHAQQIWQMRHDRAAVERTRVSLDRGAARVGRILLSPFCSVLQ